MSLLVTKLKSSLYLFLFLFFYRNHPDRIHCSLLKLTLFLSPPRLLLPLSQQVYEPDHKALCEVKGQPPVGVRTQHLPWDRTGQTGLSLCRVSYSHFTEWVWRKKSKKKSRKQNQTCRPGWCDLVHYLIITHSKSLQISSITFPNSFPHFL